MPKQNRKAGSSDELFLKEIKSLAEGERALAIFSSEDSIDRAIPHFDKVLEAYPNNILARAMRAECRMIYNLQIDDVVADCLHILREEPDRWRIQYILGRAYVMLARYDEAIKHLELARKHMPNDTDILHNLALAYGVGPKDYKKALRHARRAAQVNPEDERAHYLIIMMLRQSGEEDKASEYSLWLNDHNPNVFNSLFPPARTVSAHGNGNGNGNGSSGLPNWIKELSDSLSYCIEFKSPGALMLNLSGDQELYILQLFPGPLETNFDVPEEFFSFPLINSFDIKTAQQLLTQVDDTSLGIDDEDRHYLTLEGKHKEHHVVIQIYTQPLIEEL